MRAAYRIVRVLVGFAVLALSVGWLLLRRRRGPLDPPASGPRLTVVPAVSEPDNPPVEPRGPQPLGSLGQPVHDLAAPEPEPEPAAVPDPATAPDPATGLGTAPGPAPAATTAVEEPVAADPPPATDPPPAIEAPPAADPAPAAEAAPAGAPASATAGGEPARVSPNGTAAVVDDLREIRGIGPATEAALHALGIHSFRQLAVLDAAGREELRAALRDTRQRMERDDWVGQAAELHRAKYGENPLRPD